MFLGGSISGSGRGGMLMKLIIDLGGRRVEELHPSEELARSHLSIVLHSHRSRGHRVARPPKEDQGVTRFIVHTPEGALQYWLEQ
jgi:hypothetical protein